MRALPIRVLVPADPDTRHRAIISNVATEADSPAGVATVLVAILVAVAAAITRARAHGPRNAQPVAAALDASDRGDPHPATVIVAVTAILLASLGPGRIGALPDRLAIGDAVPIAEQAIDDVRDRIARTLIVAIALIVAGPWVNLLRVWLRICLRVRLRVRLRICLLILLPVRIGILRSGGAQTATSAAVAAR